MRQSYPLRRRRASQRPTNDQPPDDAHSVGRLVMKEENAYWEVVRIWRT